jgi:uncharacterized membrane protein
MAVTANGSSNRRFVTAGLLLGVGLGGFVDGIVLHQILRWHHMLTSTDSDNRGLRDYPATTVAGLEVNTLWDGLFHATTWLFVAVGLGLLWRAWQHRQAPRAGRSLVGLLLAGWGLFNLVEGIVDHHLLGIHHVRAGPHQLLYDLGSWPWARCCWPAAGRCRPGSGLASAGRAGPGIGPRAGPGDQRVGVGVDRPDHRGQRQAPVAAAARGGRGVPAPARHPGLVPTDRGAAPHGVRTRQEIDAERYALKAIRGDFQDNAHSPGQQVHAARALGAVRAWTLGVEPSSLGPWLVQRGDRC